MRARGHETSDGQVRPRVSLILCVKNGMPYLPQAVASVAAQTFRNFELVVQDGGSTDGTLEYLSQVDDLPGIDIVSASDTGIGQAYNRALQRCRGDLIGSIDADNQLATDALAHIMVEVENHPECAAVYGASVIVDADGAVLRTFVPEPFELLRVIACEVVPPFASAFFVRDKCAAALRFDERLATCADYDLWLRLGHLQIRRTDAVLGSTRLSEKSMTRDVRRYDQFCHDKELALRRFLGGKGAKLVQQQLTEGALAGIYLWAAESIQELEGPSPRFFEFCNRAKMLHGESARLKRIVAAAQPVAPRPESVAETADAEAEAADLVRGLEERVATAEAALADATATCAGLARALDEAAASHHELEQQLEATHVALQKAESDVAWMRETRVWRLGTLYWRMNYKMRRSFSWFQRS